MQGELLAWFDWLAAFAAAHPLDSWTLAVAVPLLAALALGRVIARRKRAAAAPALPAPPAAEIAETAPTAAETAPVPAPPAVPAPARLRDRLRRTSDALVGRLAQLVEGRRVDAELLGELERLLFSADLGVKTAESLLQTVRAQAAGADADQVRRVLREAILAKLKRSAGRPRSPARRAAARDPGAGRERLRQDHQHRQARGALPRRGSHGDPGRGRHFPGGRHRPAPDLGRADRLRGDRREPGQRSVGGGLRHAQGGPGARRRRRDHRHRRASPDQAAADGGARQAARG